MAYGSTYSQWCYLQSERDGTEGVKDLLQGPPMFEKRREKKKKGWVRVSEACEGEVMKVMRVMRLRGV